MKHTLSFITVTTTGKATYFHSWGGGHQVINFSSHDEAKQYARERGIEYKSDHEKRGL